MAVIIKKMSTSPMIPNTLDESIVDAISNDLEYSATHTTSTPPSNASNAFSTITTEDPSALPDRPSNIPKSVYGWAAVVSFASFVYGYNTGMIASAIIFIPLSISMSEREIALVVSILLFGAMIGSIISGYMADKIGRRRTIIWNNMVMLLASLFAAFGDSVLLLTLSRFILGLGVGIASVIPGLYLTEISPAHIRGELGAMNQLNGWVGIIVSYIVGWGIAGCNKSGDLCWRNMFASGAVLCILHWFLTIAFLPESPRWLESQGRTTDALQIIEKIYGLENKSHIQHQYALLKQRPTQAEPTLLSGISFIKTPKYKKVLLFSTVMQLIQHASGTGAIIYYTSFMLKENFGWTDSKALLTNALCSIPQFAVLIWVVKTLDKSGRKPALLYSQLGIVVSLIILSIGCMFGDGITSSHSSVIQTTLFIVGIIGHRMSFSFGLGPVPTVLISEILPFSIRGRALSLVLAFNWFCNFVVAATFPILMGSLLPHWIVFMVFALLGILSWMYMHENVEETKGMCLSHIEGMANGDGDDDDKEEEEVGSMAGLGNIDPTPIEDEGLVENASNSKIASKASIRSTSTSTVKARPITSNEAIP